MRIGFCTQWFPPERALIPQQIAQGILANGHDLEVLTGFPNYPTGRLHDGYPLRPYRLDEWRGAPVHRAPLYPSHGASAVGRIANYLSWAGAASAVAQARVPKVDAWVVYSSPVTAGLPPVLSPRHHGTPVLTLVQDLWPDSVLDSGMAPALAGGPLGRALQGMCTSLYRRSSLIGVISPGMRHLLVSRGVDDDRIVDLPNWLEDGHLDPFTPASPARRRSLGLPEGRTFLYAGNLGRLQRLEPLVEAFSLRPEAHLVLLGDGVVRQELRDLAARLGASNVHFLDPVPASEVGQFISAADAAVVSLADTHLLRNTMPSKVQASLAAGRPVLAHAAGDVAELITASGAGVAVPPGNVASITGAIDHLMSQDSEGWRSIGAAARTTYESTFSPAAGAQRLEAALQHMTKEIA